TGTVVLERTGDFVVPVEVEVEFADGTVSRGWWSGRERARVLRYPGRRVVRASLDPRGRLVLEPDRSDNHRYAPGPTRRGAATAIGAASEALACAVLLPVTACLNPARRLAGICSRGSPPGGSWSSRWRA